MLNIFYGWYIVAATVVIRILNSGVFTYGFTAMVNPLVTTFGWSYAQISLVMSLRGAESGLFRPFIGIIADRWPPKWLVLIGVVIMGLGLLCMSQITSLVMFYATFLLIGLGGSLGIFLVPTTTVARWFERNIGKANGVLSLGFSIGGLLVPIVTKMLDAYGWQTSLIIFAIVWLAIGIPLSFVFRTRPEDYGLLPDGKPKEKFSRSSPGQDFSLGVKEAIRTSAFWLISIAFMLQMAGIGAMLTHVMPYLVSVGMDRSTASMVAMFIPLVALPMRLLYGWLADIFNKKYVASISMLLTGAGLFLFSLVSRDSFGLTILFFIVYGIGYAGMSPLRPPIMREYFGTRRFGTIWGLSGTFSTIAMMVTPLVAGWLFDTQGTYHPIWLILSGACMIGAILMLMMPSKIKQDQRMRDE